MAPRNSSPYWLVAAMVALAGLLSSASQPSPECTSPDQCRELTLAALARQEYERAHDLAWRVVQTSPRRDRDPAALSLLARAQSLSGRGYDALIMLQRLADMGVIVDDADTSDDFRRVRDYPAWSQLRDTIDKLRASRATGATGAAPARGTLDAPAARAPSTPAPVTPGAPGAPAAPLGRVTIPATVVQPVALAYDAVSARFIVATSDSDVLQVISESSGNAMNLVSAGWAGGSRITALAIDRASGTLWVAGTSGATATLYRVQLISGRRLNASQSDPKLNLTSLTALAIAPSTVYALDAAGRRIVSLDGRAQSVRVHSTLPADIAPTGLAYGGGALWVAHAAGLLRLDLASTARRSVTSSAADSSNLHSLAWHNGTLLGIQRKGSTAHAVRVRLDARGTAVTAIEHIEPAVTEAAALSNNAYYFLTGGPSGTEIKGVVMAK